MAALPRSELKSLVREILIELLEEGLGGFSARSPVTQQKRQVVPEATRKRPFNPSIDAPVRRDVMREAIKREAGGNQLMASILADTAASTLPEMATHDRSLGANTMSEGMSPSIQQVERINGSPEEVFGTDVTSKWADLAFAEPKRVGG